MTMGSIDPQWSRLCSRAFNAPWLTQERERELLVRAQANDERAKAELYDSYLRLVVQIASRYRRGRVSAEDLVSEGGLGLLEAIVRFDISKQTRLGTYAAWWIKAYIRRYVHANRGVVLPPSTRCVRRAFANSGRAERELTHSLGRAPIRSEIAELLGVSEDDVAVWQTSAFAPVSLCPFQGSDVRDDAPDPEEQCVVLDLTATRNRVVRSCVESLEERERQIIEALFSEESASMAALGETLGVSRQRISQIVKRVRTKLTKELTRREPALREAITA